MIVCKAQEIYTITISNAHRISSNSIKNPGLIILRDQMGTIVKIEKNKGYAQYDEMTKTIKVSSIDPDISFFMNYQINSQTGFIQVGTYVATIDKCNL